MATRAWFFVFTDWAMRSSHIPQVLLAVNLIVQGTERAKKAAAASKTHSLGRKKRNSTVKPFAFKASTVGDIFNKNHSQNVLAIKVNLLRGAYSCTKYFCIRISLTLASSNDLTCTYTVDSYCSFHPQDYLVLIPLRTHLLNSFTFLAFLFGIRMHYIA